MLEVALKLLGLVAVSTYMLEIGLASPPGQLVESARRHKGELARTLVVMLVLGPLVARILAAAFALEPRPAVALVLLSYVGVLPLASRGARSARADVSFAVVLTVALGIVSAFTAAPTTGLLLGYHGPVEVQTGALLLQILLLQAAPIALGVFIRSRTERTRALEKVLRIFSTAALAVLVVIAIVLLPRYGAVRSLGWSGGLAAVVFAVLIALAGYALSGREPPERRTVSAISNMPNVVLAILIVSSAGVDAGFAIAVVGLFLVRFVVGALIQRVLARSSSSERMRRRAPASADEGSLTGTAASPRP